MNLKSKVKRIETLLKLNILENANNNKQIKELFDELIQGGYPRELLKAKLQILKNNFLEDKELNMMLSGVKCLTPSDIKFREEMKKIQILGFDEV